MNKLNDSSSSEPEDYNFPPSQDNIYELEVGEFDILFEYFDPKNIDYELSAFRQSTLEASLRADIRIRNENDQ